MTPTAVICTGTESDPEQRIRTSRGRKIRQIREARGMTPAEFAEAVGVTKGAVSQWETGRFTPRPAVQRRIARALDTPWYLLFGLDEV